VFCGRENEIRQIEDHCRTGRHVVIVHASGMGATTLLEEGLLPAWKAQGCITISFRDWQGRGVVNEFRDAVASAVRQQADPDFLLQPESISEMFERIRQRTHRPTAMFLDQFEDYVRCHFGTDLADTFDAELAHAISSRECRFIIALQDHALAGFRRFEQYIPNLLGSRVELGPVDAAAAKELVARAAAEKGVVFEPAVVDALVSAPAAAYKGGIHPFFVMAGVQRLIDAAGEKKAAETGAGVLQVYGGADRLILESFDVKLQPLKPTHAELFFRWCNLLLSDKDERQAVTSKALTDYSGKLNRFALSLLPALTENGILRTVDLPGGTRYEIARDCWAPLIRDWWRRREAALIARRRAQFRVRSLSVAAGSIVAIYLVWLFMSWKK